MRYFYTFLFYLILPLVMLRLLWRSIRQPAYQKRIAERFGFYPKQWQKTIWVHAVSVGEVIAAVPLIKFIQKEYPALPIIVTTMTPTGAERVRANLADEVTHLYLPYDLPGAVKRFLNATHPVLGIMMETELWPNLLAACRKQQVPICLMNARLSASSAARYQKVSMLLKPMLQGITCIAANETADAERFIKLGAVAEKVIVTGNIKFDVSLPEDIESQKGSLKQTLGERFIWVAASTHVGEEEAILAAHRVLLETVDPMALLILVPRHPNRFATVAKLCRAQFNTVLRSQAPTVTNETAVYLADTMGELLLMYSVADVVFVGGSLVPHGGHNILEPALVCKPIMTGPYLKNFLVMSELFQAQQALLIVEDTAALIEQLKKLRHNMADRERLGQRAHAVLLANRGALNRQKQIIKRQLCGALLR